MNYKSVYKLKHIVNNLFTIMSQCVNSNTVLYNHRGKEKIKAVRKD